MQSLIILIPARGRKHFNFKHFYCLLQIILIPARGRKLIVVRDFLDYPYDYTHPREGTETYKQFRCKRRSLGLYSSP